MQAKKYWHMEIYMLVQMYIFYTRAGLKVFVKTYEQSRLYPYDNGFKKTAVIIDKAYPR